ncbi:MarR family transcriptional regulator [Nocardia sp. NBC_00881]|uniref:MarR family winged helix-turn-helix transcriptional regulator n=1 Tax=Nocardia sp. NBC_00881 TaxID=2975995 RepID=UPI00386393CD|nr:MarR family transcriptional regulator [Nocardia sp. NBC_00881]
MTREPKPTVDTELDRDVCKLVHRFTHRLDVHVRRVAEQLELTPSQVIALRELSEPITARELAGRMSCEPSNATFVLDRLEQQDLIRREPHPSDRRAKQIVLTSAGQRRREDALELLGANSPLTSLTETQQQALRDLLSRMTSAPQP